MMLNPGVRTQPHALPPVEVIGNLVVVPRATGPLLDLATSDGPGDDLDEAIDELFGETTQERPGWLDVSLVIGGTTFAARLIASGAWLPALILGGSLVLLGLALPARDVLARSRQRRNAATQRRAIGDGLPLDASDPSVHALVDAYAACLAIAGQTGDERGREAAAAAHLAMVEVASLLAGQRPVADAEIDYVDNRTRAIERLTTSLRGMERGLGDARLARLPDRTTVEQEWATAVTRAREELESDTGLGSLDRLAALTTATEETAADAAR